MQIWRGHVISDIPPAVFFNSPWLLMTLSYVADSSRLPRARLTVIPAQTGSAISCRV
jgi:hypothetical protein